MNEYLPEDFERAKRFVSVHGEYLHWEAFCEALAIEFAKVRRETYADHLALAKADKESHDQA